MGSLKDILHSHSGLERTLVMPKNKVIIDANFKTLFPLEYVELFKYKGHYYCIVPTILFVKRFGVFKNYDL